MAANTVLTRAENSGIVKKRNNKNAKLILKPKNIFPGSPTRVISSKFKTRKRRKKCGVCGPCQIRENCHTCLCCISRKTGKQICKYRKCDKIKEEQKQRNRKLKNHLQKPAEYSEAVRNNGQNGISRKTPEIFEPRKAFNEPDSLLKKKLKPFTQNGIVAELPSIDTFCNYTNGFLRKQSSPFKRKGNFMKGQKHTVKMKKKNINISPTSCGCDVSEEDFSGPFYTHLGSGKTLEDLRFKLKTQLAISDEALRLHLVRYTSTEGKNGDGCPLAKWVLRRTGPQEMYLVVAKNNKGHTCTGAFSVIALVAWEGISKQYADDMYSYLTSNLNRSGFSTRRRCGANESKTCMCQGENEETNGASFSFGCSWSLFFDGCKFSKSVAARKFKMQEPEKEMELETVLQDMATNVSPLLNIWAPKAFENMTRFENTASDCRIGKNVGRPFSGVTMCMDFCAHSHKDMHNMPNGTTMVCTLLKPDYNERQDEQLHVLPLYQPIDEYGQVIPTNYQIPSHFMKSKIQVRQEPLEGKGKYVMPVKVNTNTKHTERETMNKNASLDPTVAFKDELAIQNMVAKGYTDDWNAYIPESTTNHYTHYTEDVKQMHPTFVDDCKISSLNHQLFDSQVLTESTIKQETTPTVSTPPKAKFLPKPTEITHNMGGVGIALGHGSFIVECAKKELHATTALRNPQRNKPTRISMVFYQHKKLNKANHGFHEYKEKMRKREEQKRQDKQSFDDLALLATTASLNDSNISLDRSFENTPEKNNNPLLELCKQGLLERHHSNSEPNIPSLFTNNILPTNTNLFDKKFPLSLAHENNVPSTNVLGIETRKEPTKMVADDKFSINTLIGGTSNHEPIATHSQQKLPNPTAESLTKKLPTISIFSKRVQSDGPSNLEHSYNFNTSNLDKLSKRTNENIVTAFPTDKCDMRTSQVTQKDLRDILELPNSSKNTTVVHSSLASNDGVEKHNISAPYNTSSTLPPHNSILKHSYTHPNGGELPKPFSPGHMATPPHHLHYQNSAQLISSISTVQDKPELEQNPSYSSTAKHNMKAMVIPSNSKDINKSTIDTSNVFLPINSNVNFIPSNTLQHPRNTLQHPRNILLRRLAENAKNKNTQNCFQNAESSLQPSRQNVSESVKSGFQPSHHNIVEPVESGFEPSHQNLAESVKPSWQPSHQNSFESVKSGFQPSHQNVLESVKSVFQPSQNNQVENIDRPDFSLQQNGQTTAPHPGINIYKSIEDKNNSSSRQPSDPGHIPSFNQITEHIKPSQPTEEGTSKMENGFQTHRQLITQQLLSFHEHHRRQSTENTSSFNNVKQPLHNTPHICTNNNNSNNNDNYRQAYIQYQMNNDAAVRASMYNHQLEPNATGTRMYNNHLRPNGHQINNAAAGERMYNNQLEPNGHQINNAAAGDRICNNQLKPNGHQPTLLDVHAARWNSHPMYPSAPNVANHNEMKSQLDMWMMQNKAAHHAYYNNR